MVVRRLAALILLSVVAGAEIAAAATIEYPLLLLEGDFETPLIVRSQDIDLGVEFERIDSIWLRGESVGQCPGSPCLRATEFEIRFTGLNPPFDGPVFIPATPSGPLDGPFSFDIVLPEPAGFLDGQGFLSLSLVS